MNIWQLLLYIGIALAFAVPVRLFIFWMRCWFFAKGANPAAKLPAWFVDGISCGIFSNVRLKLALMSLGDYGLLGGGHFRYYAWHGKVTMVSLGCGTAASISLSPWVDGLLLSFPTSAWRYLRRSVLQNERILPVPAPYGCVGLAMKLEGMTFADFVQCRNIVRAFCADGAEISKSVEAQSIASSNAVAKLLNGGLESVDFEAMGLPESWKLEGVVHQLLSELRFSDLEVKSDGYSMRLRHRQEIGFLTVGEDFSDPIIRLLASSAISENGIPLPLHQGVKVWRGAVMERGAFADQKRREQLLADMSTEAVRIQREVSLLSPARQGGQDDIAAEAQRRIAAHQGKLADLQSAMRELFGDPAAPAALAMNDIVVGSEVP